jgi:uncharacterized protein
MKKRLRKKKHLKEFREWGVTITITINLKQNVKSFCDDFLTNVLEPNKCYFGGGTIDNVLDGIIELGSNLNSIDSKLSCIKLWLDNRDDVDNYVISEKINLCYPKKNNY